MDTESRQADICDLSFFYLNLFYSGMPRIIRIICLLTTIITLPVHTFAAERQPAASEPSKQNVTNASDQKEIAALAGIRGADMTVYNLYETNRKVNPEKAAEYAEVFLEKVDTSATSLPIADCRLFLARYYETSRGFFTKAIGLTRRASQTFIKLGKNQRAADAILQTGRLYLKKERLDSAYIAITQAMDMFGDAEPARTAECNKLLGVIFNSAKAPELARRYFQESLRIYQELGDSAQVSVGFANSSALSFLAGNDLRKAKMLLTEAVAIAEKSNNKNALADIYLNLAGLAVSESNFSATDSWLEKAEPLAHSIEQRGLMSKIRAQKAILLSDNKGAIDELNRCIAIYSEGEFSHKLVDVYATLSNLYNLRGNDAEALRYSRLAADADDTDANREIFINLFRMQKDREVAAISAAEKSHTQRTILIFGGILLLLASAAVFLTWRLTEKHTRRNMSEQLRKAEERISELNDLSLYSKQTIIAESAERLRKLSADCRAPGLKARLFEICSTLESSTDERTLREIENYVPGFNSELYRNLVKDFPNLTPNESRICVLVAMNMSTKQISDITNQSVDAINMSRTRLRRKLGLTGKSESLQEFLNRYR